MRIVWRWMWQLICPGDAAERVHSGFGLVLDERLAAVKVIDLVQTGGRS